MELEKGNTHQRCNKNNYKENIMNFIKSHFENFPIELYFPLALIFLCLIYSLFNPLSNGRYIKSPIWTTIISFIAFSKFDVSDYHLDNIILYGSILILGWLAYIYFDEKSENEDRNFVRNGKNSVSNIYNSGKSHLRGKANKAVGGGFFGDLANSFMDGYSEKADNKVGGFLNSFFGDTSEYLNDTRGLLGVLRLILLLVMIISIFYLR